VDPPFVAAGERPRRHRGDVRRVDGRGRDVRELRADRVAFAQLREPAQRVRHERARPQERPVQPRLADRAFGEGQVRRDRVVQVFQRRRAAGQQHDPADARVARLRQHAGHVVVPGQQKDPVDALQSAFQTGGIVEIAYDGLGAVRQHGVRPAHQRPDRFTRFRQCRNHFRADVAGGAGDQEHRSTPRVGSRPA
jgi:hypothetical protein